MEKPDIEGLARRLTEGLPASVQAFRADLAAHFSRVLHAGVKQLELVSREEFDAQTRVLERSRAVIGELEARVAALEAKQPTSGR